MVAKLGKDVVDKSGLGFYIRLKTYSNNNASLDQGPERTAILSNYYSIDMFKIHTVHELMSTLYPEI